MAFDEIMKKNADHVMDGSKKRHVQGRNILLQND